MKIQLDKIKNAPSDKKLTSLCRELRRACWQHLVAPVPLPRFEFPCCIPLIINKTCMSVFSVGRGRIKTFLNQAIEMLGFL